MLYPVLPNFQIREPRVSAFAMRKKGRPDATSQCISLSPKQASNVRKPRKNLRIAEKCLLLQRNMCYRNPCYVIVKHIVND